MSSDHSESIGKAHLATCNSILHNCVKDKYTHIADTCEWAMPVVKIVFGVGSLILAFVLCGHLLGKG